MRLYSLRTHHKLCSLNHSSTINYGKFKHLRDRMEKKIIELPLLDSNFELEKAVCNHGFFMMAPNKWSPHERSLVRPLSLSVNGNTVGVTVSIHKPLDKNFLVINYHHHQGINISPEHIGKLIRDQVSRMLRISSDDEIQLQEFHRIHPQSKEKGFGRVFRSPTLFEDIVKSVLLCNCSWARSLEMAKALCDLQYKMCNGMIANIKGRRPLKRKRSAKSDGGNFPSAKELACLDEETLKKQCKLGFRASTILKLAQQVSNGSLDLVKHLEQETNPDKLVRKLERIKGFGPFTVANIMMCLGFYQRVPIDTETIKHVKEVHRKEDIKNNKLTAVIAEIYDKYAPYQCLAYWQEHVEHYEKVVGKLSELPHSEYHNVATTKMIKPEANQPGS